MIIIIPLAGIGQRFRQCGYKHPKPLVNVMGKPIIFWVLDNLKLDNIDAVVIPYNSDLEKYNFENMVHKRYPKINFKFLKLTCQTQGAAETVLKGIQMIKQPDCPILCIDGDNFYTYDIISQWNGNNSVFYFDDTSESSAYSFIKINDNNELLSIAEKERISDHASCGAYGFRSYSEFKIYCEKVIKLNLKQKNEFYISSVIKLMVDEGFIFNAKNVSIHNYVCLGTPLDVRLFCNNYPRISAHNGTLVLAPQRYCFDLDNTLVTYPELSGDYTTVKPIQKTIDFLKYLKNFGHTIIIYTARRMNTHNGNVGKVMADIGKITFDTLEKFNIPYDEIYFGKPYADYYIDDCAVSPYDDLEKDLGFYKSTFDTRSFNSISSDIIPVYKKIGSDLSGEIYWYTHIPTIIKDMFPLFFSYDVENKFYTMERINGIPFSRLMLSEDLTVEHLKHIMNSIERIHSTNIPITEGSKNINMYDNYCTKLMDRYEKYNYSNFKNSSTVYSLLYNKLKEYETNSLGRKGIIHGDTILTNILINQFGKIKFIDMRGKIGKTLTIIGDQYYDWAKLYQSLIGYDEILEDKFVSIVYKNMLLDFFNKRFVDTYGEIQWKYLQYITASLLFTLIPLHDNDKCSAYYNLIFKFDIQI
ncbi:MAG: hypothetical protein Satyrvirus33_10 [Satyrvirus sp.]|uniref:Nucleotidyl transferase domain-containing protein n=1 Tax=Satyrvirus sp. TaxID=2487771 RepID=A0A3G5AEV9_9VIRU|nr:MAG: hypothetical protein Satyrvirus33_10 [Satyrvirus sp.]